MRLLFNISTIFKNEKGITAVYVALLIPIFLGFAALAIDVGFIKVTQNELQNAADAAALEGVRALIAATDPKLAAQTVASYNKVLLEYIIPDDDHVKFKQPDANTVWVRVIANRQIPTFFRIENANIYSAKATANKVSGRPMLIQQNFLDPL